MSDYWTETNIKFNLYAILVLIVYTSFILLIKNWIFLIIYIIFWLIYIIIGRYVTCRHCDYLGKPCPSWNMGLIAAKIYTRSDKKNFAEAGIWKLFILDIVPLMLAHILPIFIYFFPFFISLGLNILDWILISLYMILLGITLYIHQTKGCSKCNIEGCPLGSFHKKKKADKG